MNKGSNDLPAQFQHFHKRYRIIWTISMTMSINVPGVKNRDILYILSGFLSFFSCVSGGVFCAELVNDAFDNLLF